MTSTPGSLKHYPLVQINDGKDLGDNHTLTKQLNLIGHNKQVIDFGCATGYFAQFLNQRGCQVVGVELNPEAAKIAEQHCKQVFVADLDLVSIPEVLADQKFEVAVFGDILEHLRDPWRVLEEVRQILQPEGYVVASIPNIAHGAVRLALLQGKFEYADLGLLDNTHLRFFTRKTVQELFERTGYLVDVIDRTVIPMFSDSPLVPTVERDGLNNELIQQVEQAEDADTLQFVLRAFPMSPEGKYAALNLKYSHAIDQNLQLQSDSSMIQAELGQFKSQLHQTQIELHQTQAGVKNLEAENDYLRSQVDWFQEFRTRVENENRILYAGLEQFRNRVRAIEASKFWKIRQAWFGLRGILGLRETPFIPPNVELQLAQEIASSLPSAQSNTPQEIASSTPPTQPNTP